MFKEVRFQFLETSKKSARQGKDPEEQQQQPIPHPQKQTLLEKGILTAQSLLMTKLSKDRVSHLYTISSHPDGPDRCFLSVWDGAVGTLQFKLEVSSPQVFNSILGLRLRYMPVPGKNDPLPIIQLFTAGPWDGCRRLDNQPLQTSAIIMSEYALDLYGCRVVPYRKKTITMPQNITISAADIETDTDEADEEFPSRPFRDRTRSLSISLEGGNMALYLITSNKLIIHKSFRNLTFSISLEQNGSPLYLEPWMDPSSQNWSRDSSKLIIFCFSENKGIQKGYGQIRVYDTTKGIILSSIPVPVCDCTFWSYRFMGNGEYFALILSGNIDQKVLTINFYDTPSGKKTKSLHYHNPRESLCVHQFGVSPDGSLLGILMSSSAAPMEQKIIIFDSQDTQHVFSQIPLVPHPDCTPEQVQMTHISMHGQIDKGLCIHTWSEEQNRNELFNISHRHLLITMLNTNTDRAAPFYQSGFSKEIIPSTKKALFRKVALSKIARIHNRQSPTI